MRPTIIAATVSVLMAAAPAFATPFTFPVAGDPYTWQGNSGTLGDAGNATHSMWTAGNAITHTITGSGLTSINALSYSYSVYNALYNGATATVDFLINGILVDTHLFTAGRPGTSVATDTVTFSPIVGNGTYVLTLQLANAIALGSIAFYQGGTADLQSIDVPEPASAALLAGGLLALSLRRRRG